MELDRHGGLSVFNSVDESSQKQVDQSGLFKKARVRHAIQFGLGILVDSAMDERACLMGNIPIGSGDVVGVGIVVHGQKSMISRLFLLRTLRCGCEFPRELALSMSSLGSGARPVHRCG